MKIFMHPRHTHIGEMTFDDLYDEISSDWEEKARKLQVRRWRALNREARGLSSI